MGRSALGTAFVLHMFALLLLLHCTSTDDTGNGTTQQPDPGGTAPQVRVVLVTLPDSEAVWLGGQCCDTIKWSNALGDSVQVRVYNDSSVLDFESEWTANDSLYVTTGPLPTTWPTSSEYLVQIIDASGNVGWSDPFTVQADTFATILVSSPSLASVWTAGQSIPDILWSAGSPGGDSVRIEIFRNNLRLETIAESSDNDSRHSTSATLSHSLGTGSGYRIKITDDLGYYGWSAPFELEGDICGTVVVSTPDTSSVWRHGQENVSVVWNRSCGSDVRLELYKGTTRLDTISTWISNTGQYTRKAIVPTTWGSGNDYRVRIEEECGTFGYSHKFTVEQDTLAQVTVVDPSSSTVWRWGQTGMPIRWSNTVGSYVGVYLYHSDTLVSQLHDWSVVETLVVVGDSLNHEWGHGSGYRVKVLDGQGYHGWSGAFRIDSSGSLRFSDPSSASVWLHGDSNVTARFTGSSGDSARIDLYSDDTLVDGFVGWTPVTDSFTRDSVIPASWGRGVAYKLKVTDNTGNYGWSDAFGIYPDTMPVIVVVRPDSQTVWYHGQDSVTVLLSIAEDDTVLGDSLKVSLYRDGIPTAVFLNWAPKDTLLWYSSAIPSWWGTGDDFVLRVEDDLMHHGWSDEFSIVADSLEKISVISPDSGTVLAHGQADIPVQWLGSLGDSVVVLLLKGNTLVDTFCSWDVDSGSLVRSDTVVASWGTGHAFQLKIIDNQGYFGLSDTFAIEDDTLSALTVLYPDRYSVWYHNEDSTLVQWVGEVGDSVTVDLYKGDTFVDLFSACSGDSLQSCMRSDSIPTAWGTGDGFKVRVGDENGRYGWSELFTISVR